MSRRPLDPDAAVRALLRLFDREDAAIARRAYGALADIAREKAALADDLEAWLAEGAMAAGATERREAAALVARARRSERRLAAVAHGLRNAAARLAEVRREAARLGAYAPDGRALAAARAGRIARNA